MTKRYRRDVTRCGHGVDTRYQCIRDSRFEVVDMSTGASYFLCGDHKDALVDKLREKGRTSVVRSRGHSINDLLR